MLGCRRLTLAFCDVYEYFGCRDSIHDLLVFCNKLMSNSIFFFRCLQRMLVIRAFY